MRKKKGEMEDRGMRLRDANYLNKIDMHKVDMHKVDMQQKCVV